ncbi:MAG TPA: hypothetical protein DCF33_20910 [Saprospirales bacterium]|nr:hypothetical protein [Saprospirales bacterium]
MMNTINSKFSIPAQCYYISVSLLIMLTLLQPSSIRAEQVVDRSYFQQNDSIPKRKIGIRWNVSPKTSFICTFYNANGDIANEMKANEFPNLSPFSDLDFAVANNSLDVLIKDEIDGVQKYDLRRVTFKDKKQAFKKSNIIGISDSILTGINKIIRYRNEFHFQKGDQFLIVTSTAKILDHELRGDTSWDQTHVSIYN